MKKITFLLLALLLLFLLVGCVKVSTPTQNKHYNFDSKTTLNESVAYKTIDDNNTTTKATDNTLNNAETISKDEAIDIALNHAKFKKDEVARLHAEYDFDDGIYKYDVNFNQGKYEYDYEINAQTSEILHFEKDYE